MAQTTSEIWIKSKKKLFVLKSVIKNGVLPKTFSTYYWAISFSNCQSVPSEIIWSLTLVWKKNCNLPQFSEYGGFDPLVVTQLITNYRSHPSILALYSDLFYDGLLEPAAGTDCVPDWFTRFPAWLPNFPVGVQHIEGQMRRNDRSRSCFNDAEAEAVVRFVSNRFSCRK